MTGRKIIALSLSLALLPAAAIAQNSGTQAEQDACTPDVFSLCQDYIPNEGPIVACLKSKRPQLSAPCSLVMFPAKRSTVRPGKKRHHRSHAT